MAINNPLAEVFDNKTTIIRCGKIKTAERKAVSDGFSGILHH